MPKTVYFIRHAKSSWDDIGMKDHDRPLNKRGKRDAPFMAQKLLDSDKILDQIITSTATRAKETAHAFQKAFNLEASAISEDAELYHGDLEDYLEGVRVWAKDESRAVALFAHNPGMTYLANNFAQRYIDNIPTCGISKVVFAVERYADITEHNGRLEALYYPKLYI